MSMFAVLNSALPRFIQLMIVLILIASMTSDFFKKDIYSALLYQDARWLLHKTNGSILHYQHMRIQFDGGIFILLSLTDDALRKQSLILFKDQLTHEQLRMIHVFSQFPHKKIN
jgi:predicted ABC-type exoprotein transport system permease subunit